MKCADDLHLLVVYMYIKFSITHYDDVLVIIIIIANDQYSW